MFDTSHLQELRFNLQSEDSVIPMVALINQNKLPTGVAIKCIEESIDNPYLVVLPVSKFNSLFLDDALSEEELAQIYGLVTESSDEVDSGNESESLPE